MMKRISVRSSHEIATRGQDRESRSSRSQRGYAAERASRQFFMSVHAPNQLAYRLICGRRYALRRGAQRDAGTDECFVTNACGARAGSCLRTTPGSLKWWTPTGWRCEPAFFAYFLCGGKESRVLPRTGAKLIDQKQNKERPTPRQTTKTNRNRPPGKQGKANAVGKQPEQAAAGKTQPIIAATQPPPSDERSPPRVARDNGEPRCSSKYLGLGNITANRADCQPVNFAAVVL